MTTHEVEARVLDEQPTAVMLATLTVDEIGPWMGPALGAVASYLQRFGVGPVGMPYARYHRVDDVTFEVEAGFVASTPVAGEGEVEPSTLPAGDAAVTWHIGPYDQMVPTYEALAAWLEAHGFAADGDPWEVYLSDPAHVPASESRTEVVQPYRRA